MPTPPVKSLDDNADERREPAFRCGLKLNGDGAPGLIETLLGVFDRHDTLVRRQRPEDREKTREALGLIASNLLCARQRPDVPAIRYSRRAQDYKRMLNWTAGFGQRTFLRALDALARAEIVQLVAGRHNDFGLGRQPTMAATARFLDLCAAHGLDRSDVVPDLETLPMITVKARDKSVQPIDRETEPYRSLIADMRRINEHLIGADIGFQQAEGVPDLSLLAISPVNRPVRRVFNAVDLSRYGRLNDGFWINMEKRVRRQLTINGHGVAECDFSAFMPRALYHQLGHDWQGDPYLPPRSVQLAERKGFPLSKLRNGMKTLVNVLFSCDRERTLREIPHLNIGELMTKQKAIDHIAEYHPLLVPHFWTGIGMELTRRESDLMVTMLMDFFERGITVLPLHDALIVQRNQVEEVQEGMIYHYRNAFGFNPVVSIST